MQYVLCSSESQILTIFKLFFFLKIQTQLLCFITGFLGKRASVYFLRVSLCGSLLSPRHQTKHEKEPIFLFWPLLQRNTVFYNKKTTNGHRLGSSGKNSALLLLFLFLLMAAAVKKKNAQN